MERPRTSKPRGVCKYYSQPRGCFAGKSCKFLHGDPGTEQLTPYDKAKVCKFYQQGYCKRGDECWFRHVRAGRSAGESSIAGPSSPESDDGFEDLCSICFDKPTTYGLLGGCSHIFCIKCIRQWRDTSDNAPDNIGSDVRKKCPMCRAPSQFITPTSEFVLHGTPEKDRVIAAYRDSMKKVKCRYFQASVGNSRGRPGCPFGKDCFYLHQNADGTPYVFTEGIPTSFRRFRSQRPTPLPSQVDYIAQSLGLIQHIFDHPMGNLGLSLEVIRTGLGQVGVALDRMAPTPGAAPLEPSHRSRGSTADDGNDRREGAPEMGRDGLERMTGRLLDTINSIRMRAGREVHPESDDDNDDHDDDPISLWPTDMPALVPYEQTEQAEEDAEATRAIFAEWHQPHVGSTPFRAPDVASIPVAGDVNVRERIDVTGSGVSTSPPIETNGSAWTRLLLDHHGGSRPRWIPGPAFGAGRGRAGGNDNMSDDSMPDLLELSDSEDGTESSDDETEAPCHPPLPSSELEYHPLEPVSDSPSSSTTPEPTSDDKSTTSPEFTTDGRGRVIAASSPSAESTSAAIPSDQIKPS